MAAMQHSGCQRQPPKSAEEEVATVQYGGAVEAVLAKVTVQTISSVIRVL